MTYGIEAFFKSLLIAFHYLVCILKGILISFLPSVYVIEGLFLV